MAKTSVWPVFANVIFDCDSTLSAIEGIDELARMTGHEHDISILTKRAMEGDIPLEAVYGHRLVTTEPTREQVRKIAYAYRETVVPYAREVIHSLQELGTRVFIVSGGLFEPVRDFGIWLGVPKDHIFAVGMAYDQLAGHWWRYWEQQGGHNPRAKYLAYEPNPLAATGGKNRVIREMIREKYPGKTMLVGDGGSDLEASQNVDLFVGFGGVIYRQQVAFEAPVYIQSLSLSPILPLSTGQLGNDPRYGAIWIDGLRRIYNSEVAFNTPDIKEKFFKALRPDLSR